MPSWDKLAVDTDNPSVGADTATGAGSVLSIQRSPAAVRLPLVHGRQLWIVVAAVTAVFLLVLAGILWWAFSSSHTHANGQSVEPASRDLMVDPTGASNAFRNLQAVLIKARPGDRIVIKGDFEGMTFGFQ